MEKEFSVIIPARDESENIKEAVKDLIPFVKEHEAEIIVVNDHSKDDTSNIVKKLIDEHGLIKIVENLRPAGFANALKTGFEQASGKFVVPFMADSCDDPSTLPRMLEKGTAGYDLICGSRYTKGGCRKGGPLVQGLFSRIVGTTLSVFAGLPTKDAANAYKMYRRRVLASMELKEEGFAVSMEACTKFFLGGYKICDVPTLWSGRKKGKSKFRLSKTLPYVRIYLTTIWKKWIFRL